ETAVDQDLALMGTDGLCHDLAAIPVQRCRAVAQREQDGVAVGQQGRRLRQRRAFKLNQAFGLSTSNWNTVDTRGALVEHDVIAAPGEGAGAGALDGHHRPATQRKPHYRPTWS